MIIIRETAGDTLQGDIDGVNKTYVATYEFFDSVGVDIYVNGRLKVRGWDDGFAVVLPKTVVLNEALLDGDSLTVEYKHGTLSGGGADGGCPSPPQIVILKPDTSAGENVSEVMANDVDPSTCSQGELVSDQFTCVLKPVIISAEEE